MLTFFHSYSRRPFVSLPLGLSHQPFDSLYLNQTIIGECPAGRLRDILAVEIDNNRTAEFVIDTRGIPADKQLFVSGTVEIQDESNNCRYQRCLIAGL